MHPLRTLAAIVLASASAAGVTTPARSTPATPSVPCALTFDDGPGRHTAELVDALDGRGVRATFFVLGEHVLREPDLLRRMVAEGHEVENHSFDHPDLRHLDRARQLQEIESTQRALHALGIEPRFFRPPYGAYDAQTQQAAARDGLLLALWTRDGKDWKYQTLHALEAYTDRALDVKTGGIYLFHDIHPWTIAAMPHIVEDLARRGCRFVTLSQYVAERPDAVRGGIVE